MNSRFCSAIAIIGFFIPLSVFAFEPNETPAGPGEWGFRPSQGETLQVTPPPFSWRPQKNARFYELQCALDPAFEDIVYQAYRIEFNVHTPPMPLESGEWYWRFRVITNDGKTSEWSRSRGFTIAGDANELPLPSKDDLIARIPKKHPRLFVRPEQIPNLKKRAKGDLKEHYESLVRECERIIENPPDTKEPPTYPEDVERKSERWREIWWGNRTYTIRALNSAATLAFTRLLGGKEGR